MAPDTNDFRTVDPEASRRYHAAGYWGDLTVGQLIDQQVAAQGDRPAFITPDHRLSWAGYRRSADRLAGALVGAGLPAGERVAVLIPDGPTLHAALVATERAGLVAVGIGGRAGEREIQHLVQRTGATALVTPATHRDEDATDLFARLQAAAPTVARHVVVPAFEATPDGDITVDGQVADPSAGDLPADRQLRPDDLFMINSTSGTTGLPKCVMHTQNQKLYMARLAVECGELGPDEIIMGAAPAPFGFGMFTTHYLPVLLGAPCVTMPRFSADGCLELLERERATVFVCVSTQFKMLLGSPDMLRRDLSSLRVMFTGGEMIPYEAARDFEDRTGATVLNFYGSNESGFATGTRTTDPREKRLRTAGRHLEGIELRLYDNRHDVTDTGRGQPASQGPTTCLGYVGDPEGNAELFVDGDFILHADIATIDEDGYLQIVGRTAEIIIRGGKNISAAAVEDAVSRHPAVVLAAAVPAPDKLFGERVCVYVELHPGQHLELAELVDLMVSQGASKETLPEHLVVMDQLPRSSGGKVAKGTLRQDAAERFGG